MSNIYKEEAVEDDFVESPAHELGVQGYVS